MNPSPVQTPLARELVDAGPGAEPVAALGLSQEFGGFRLLLSDIRLAFIVVNHARYRAIARFFGIPPDQANLLTLVAALALAEAANVRAVKLLNVPPVPATGDGLLGIGAFRELLGSFTGAPARDTPLFGTLLVIAVIGGTAGPAASRSLRVITASSRRMATGFHHRYGYIIDPGHWRQRHARQHNRAGANGGVAQPRLTGDAPFTGTSG